MLVKWGLQKYIQSSLGNYYYVYQLATKTTPDELKETTSCGIMSTGANAGSLAIHTGANMAYYGSKTALSAVGIAAGATIATGSLLLVTVTTSK